MTRSLAELRDKVGVTRMLILAELDHEPGVTLSDVATRLGITVQAVSAYAQTLTKDGLLDAERHVTPKGLQALHEEVRQLRVWPDRPWCSRWCGSGRG
ncbi:MAG: MarR family transcriptional regulator [Thermoplasmatota archaeon]